MPAYLIVEIDTRDEALMAAYRSRAPEHVARFGGRYLVRGGVTKTLEGGWQPPRLVVIEFPDMAALDGFYASPGYAPVLALRLAAGTSRTIAAEGYDG